jgi:hypothetical protein
MAKVTLRVRAFQLKPQRGFHMIVQLLMMISTRKSRLSPASNKLNALMKIAVPPKRKWLEVVGRAGLEE